jgi:hypothetical protein
MKPRSLPCLPLLLAFLLAGTDGFSAESDVAPPLPDRNPARVPTPSTPRPLLPGEVLTVPWTEAEVSAAKAKCTELLGRATLDYQPLDPIKEGICGAPAPILLKSIGNDPKVEIDPPATVTCPMASALSAWLNEVVQPNAKVLLGSQVVKLHNATSYACRNRYGAAEGLISEHAFANALDVSEFVFASGEHVTVLASWPLGPLTPPLPLPNPTRTAQATASPKFGGSGIVEVANTSDRKAEFVKQVHDDACRIFGTVLGPEANAAHKNHFHLDMKQRRGGYCE